MEEEARTPISVAEEKVAIRNHDYDQAEAIYQARLEFERQDFADDTNNILDTVDQAKIMNSSKCIQRMEKSTRNLENGRDILTSSLADELEKLANKQKEELGVLKDNWRSDREQAIHRAVERADNMILSSQELATVHCYEAARDLLAEGTQIKENPTATKEVSEIDEHYRRLTEATLARHRTDLETLRYQYSLDALLLDQKCEGECIAFRSKCDVANSNIGPSLANSNRSPNKPAALNLVRLTSPRSAQKSSKSATKGSSIYDDELPFSPPRSPNRMANRI